MWDSHLPLLLLRAGSSADSIQFHIIQCAPTVIVGRLALAGRKIQIGATLWTQAFAFRRTDRKVRDLQENFFSNIGRNIHHLGGVRNFVSA